MGRPVGGGDVGDHEGGGLPGVSDALAAPTLGTCAGGNNPENLTDGCQSMCGWYHNSPPVPEDHVYCQAATVCGAGEHAEGYAVEFSGNYVIVVRCKDSGGATQNTACCLAVDGSDEIDGIGLEGTAEPDTLGLRYPLDLNPSSSTLSSENGTIVIDGWLYGNDGGDLLLGSDESASERDRLRGGDGEDTIRCFDDGQCLVKGGDDRDIIYGGNSADVLDGGDGNDDIIAGDGEDVCYGGAGDDQIGGGSGTDKISAGSDHDLVCGDKSSYVSGVMTCGSEYGTDGDDEIDGGSGTDDITAQGGVDNVCDYDDDTITTGSGADNVSHAGSPTSVHCGSGTDTYTSGMPNTTACDTPVTPNT